MKFKVVGKSLILTDYSHKITEGENSFDAVEITVPRRHDNCDLSVLSFRFSEISEDGKNSAVQVLCQENCNENYVYLRGEITSDFSSITGKVTFMLTGINGENISAKFISSPYNINDDVSLMSLPDHTAAEQLFNQAQLEVQKAIDAANRAEIASQTPAPAEIYPAKAAQLGGVLSGKDISVDNDGVVTVNSVNGKTIEKSVPENAVFTDTVYTLPAASTEMLGGVMVDGKTIAISTNGVIFQKDAPQTPAYYHDISEKGWHRFCIIPAARTTLNCLIGINRDFNHRTPEAYQISLVCAYNKCFMKLLNSAVGTQLVPKIRTLISNFQPESHDIFLELYYDFNEINPFIINVINLSVSGKTAGIETIPLIKTEAIPEGYTSIEYSLSNQE